MRLKVMNCRNCNAPLHLEGEKLVCAFCGASFEIEKDAADIEYEKTVNTEAYILQSLNQETAALNKYYQEAEAQKLAKEQKREEEIKRRKREAQKKSIISGIKTFVILAILALGMAILVKYGSKVSAERKAREKEARIAKAEQAVSFRVTKSDLENDPEVLDEIEKMIYDFEESEYEETEKEVDDEIWTMTEEPRIVASYLLTTEKRNTFISFVKTVFATSDGREKEVYNCVALDDLTVDTKGKVKLDPKKNLYTIEASDYEYYWRGGFDQELLYEEVIMQRRRDPDVVMQFFFEIDT